MPELESQEMGLWIKAGNWMVMDFQGVSVQMD